VEIVVHPRFIRRHNCKGLGLPAQTSLEFDSGIEDAREMKAANPLNCQNVARKQ
jgi:hypothetical protein